MENASSEFDKKSDEIDFTQIVKKAKKLFDKDNPAASVFLILTLILLVLSLLGISGIGIGNNIISRFVHMFPSWILLFLTTMLFLSYLAARFNKYKLMFIPIILWLLVTTAFVRTTNIPQLKDITTNDWTLGPDLDPFLYLRIAQDINDGSLQNPDVMRYAPLGVDNFAYKNLMPWTIVIIFKIMNAFSDSSLTYAAIITPVILFLISTLGFLLFTKTIFSFKLSEKKAWLGAIIASLFYIASPSMLHRTTAGIPEIESLGMAFFWFAFLFFCLAWKSEKPKKIMLYGLLAGIFTGLMSWSWGGYKYIYMVIGLTTLMIFLLQKNEKKNLLIFVPWVASAILLEFFKIGSIKSVLTSITSTGFAFFVLFIMLVDLVLFKTKLRDATIVKKTKIPRAIISFVGGLICIIFVLLILDAGFLINAVKNTFEQFLYPFGRGRVGLTIAENKAPYLIDAIGSFGYLLWGFILGSILAFYTATKKFNLKNKVILNFFFVIFIVGFAFSRYSSTSILNGDNFISQLMYIGSLLIFGLVLIYLLIRAGIKNDEKTIQDFKEVDVSYLVLLSFAFVAIISIRGAIRLFFIVSPILAVISGFFVIGLLAYRENSKGGKKLILGIAAVLAMILLFTTFVQDYETTDISTKSTIPSSYTQQWQKAMAWTRENTPEESVFIHWWDYGYWVQTLGERATVTDGGHPIGYWDHLIGRYVLTTPYPESALSFMKTHNVSYLLVDSTDLGKYSAYSSIGSNSLGNDRASWIPILGLDVRQTQETANSTVSVYVGGSSIDKDIIYEQEGENVFLPEGNAGLAAVLFEIKKNETGEGMEQPTGIYVYNGQQFRLPLRRIYFGGKLIDFGKGVNSTVIIIPSVETSQAGGINMNSMGAIIYLSEKTQDSLFAQLYLMNDPLNIYESLELAHSEDDSLVNNLKSQGANIKDFMYYQGFRGPIKIWKVGYPQNIITKEEFLRTSGELAEFDDLVFRK